MGKPALRTPGLVSYRRGFGGVFRTIKNVLASEQSMEILIDLIYQRYLGRAPDVEGLRHHTAALRSGVSIPQLVHAIESSPEADQYRKTKAIPQLVHAAESSPEADQY